MNNEQLNGCRAILHLAIFGVTFWVTLFLLLAQSILVSIAGLIGSLLAVITFIIQYSKLRKRIRVSYVTGVIVTVVTVLALNQFSLLAVLSALTIMIEVMYVCAIWYAIKYT